ncbi:hypothetical protein AB0K75_42885, partial [Streptomyces sp. NPDC055692]
MAAETDVLILALEDARDAHVAVVGRFWTGAALTPPGTDRQRLEMPPGAQEQEMAAETDVLILALEDARDAHVAVV